MRARRGTKYKRGCGVEMHQAGREGRGGGNWCAGEERPSASLWSVQHLPDVSLRAEGWCHKQRVSPTSGGRPEMAGVVEALGGK